MTDEKRVIDWERIELDYRAGLLSVREISEAAGVSHTAVNKKAKALKWVRDLKAKIQAKADALVSKAEVSRIVSKEAMATERETIDANAQVIASIRIAHRTDIERIRTFSNTLLEELQGDGAELPSRIDMNKKLAETMKTLITLEREAYDIAAPAKVEVTGAGGGPIQTESLNVAGLSTEALAEIMSAKDAANRQ